MGKSAPEDHEVRLKERLIRSEHEYRNPVFDFLIGTPSTQKKVPERKTLKPKKTVTPSIVRRGDIVDPNWNSVSHETA